MASDGFQEYERQRAQRAREQRAASRRAARARNANPAAFDAAPPVGGFTRDPGDKRATAGPANLGSPDSGYVTRLDAYRAQVALRLANLTRQATNDRRVQRGGVTESFDDTERRAKAMAKRWKSLGLLTDELAYIDSLTISEVQDEAEAANMRISASADQAAAARQEPILYHG